MLATHITSITNNVTGVTLETDTDNALELLEELFRAWATDEAYEEMTPEELTAARADFRAEVTWTPALTGRNSWS